MTLFKHLTGIASRWLLAAAAIALPWVLLITSLWLGRTTPYTLSARWLAVAAGWTIALLTWHLVLAAAMSMASGCTLAVSLKRLSLASTPLLLAVPFLVAGYADDEFFHYLTYTPVPQAIVVWTPLLMGLALQEATLLWAIRSRRVLAWLHRRHAVPWLIFLAFACLYVFTSGGHMYSPDERAMYHVTETVANTIVPAVTTQSEAKGEVESEPYFSKYGLVPSLLAVPPYLFAWLVGWHQDPPSGAFPIPDSSYPLVDLTVGPLTMALACAVLYLLARQLRVGPLPALAVTFAFGLGTSAWVYSKTFFSQAPATLFLLATIYFLLREHERPYRDHLLAGLFLGLAVGTRMELAIVAAPFLAIPIVVQIAQNPRKGLARTAALAATFLLVSGVTVGWYNYAKTGSILLSGYGEQGTLAGFSAKPYIGIFGTLFSPGFGLFTYNPVAVLGVLGIPLLALRHRQAAYLFAGILTAAVLFYGSFGDWFGGFTWANRYMVGVLPLAVLPVALLLERPYRSPMSVALVVVATVLGFLINLLAVLIDHNQGWLNFWELSAGVHQITWDPHFSPIGAHIRVLRYFLATGDRLDWYLFYKLGVPSLVATLTLFAGLSTLAFRSALRTERAPATTHARADEARPEADQIVAGLARS